MPEINHEIEIAASADATWSVVGDAGNIADWLPALATSRLEGDMRYGTMPDGGPAVERILRHSDEDRSYSYTIAESDLPLDDYESTITVHASGDGSRVVWGAHFTADDAMTEALNGMYSEGLVALKHHIEEA